MFPRGNLQEQRRDDDRQDQERLAFQEENGEMDADDSAPPSPSPTLTSSTSMPSPAGVTGQKDKKRRSPVYQHYNHNPVLKKFFCKYCRADYKDTHQTTLLHSHYNTQHKAQNERQQGTSGFQTLFRERPVVIQKLPVAQEDNVNDKLKQLIIGCSLPFALVDNDPFIAFAKSLNPLYSLPSRNTLKTWLKEDYEKNKLRVSSARE